MMGLITKTGYHTDKQNNLIFDVWGRDENHERFHLEVIGTRPYFCTKEKPTDMPTHAQITHDERTISGEPLYKIQLYHPKEVPKYREDYTHYEGDILYKDRIRYDNNWKAYIQFPEKRRTLAPKEITPIPTPDDKIIPRVGIIDIETDTSKGFSEAEDADAEIPVITYYDSYTDKYIVIYNGTYSGDGWKEILEEHFKGSELEGKEYDVRVIPVTNESMLFRKLDELLSHLQPDILTGWNYTRFDHKYIRNRAKKMGYELNLIPHVPFDTMKGNDRLTKGTQRMKLDIQAEKILGVGKIKVPKIHEMWANDVDRLVAYNIVDVILVKEIDDKKGVMDEHLRLARLCGTDIAETEHNSHMADAYVFHRIQGKVRLPSKKFVVKLEKFEGGHVEDAETGIMKCMGVLDFKSEYPSVIIEYNISPETLVPPEDVDPDGDYYISPNGNHYLKEPEGIIPKILRELIELRDEIKREMKEAKARGDTEEFKRLYEVQRTIKYFTNSFFGLFGSKYFRLASVESAGDITAFARAHIKWIYDELEKHGYKVKYSDSLDYERRIIIKGEDGIEIVKIGKFVDDYNCEKYETLSMDLDSGKCKFKSIVRGIRHRYDYKEKGKLLEFDTTRGKTIVTPQHSIYRMNSKGEPILVDAKNVSINDKLISSINLPTNKKYESGDLINISDLDFSSDKKWLRLYKTNMQFPNKRGICPFCGKEVNLSSHVHGEHYDRRVRLDEDSSEYKFVGGKNAHIGKIPKIWKIDEELAWILGLYCADGSASNDCKWILSFGKQDRKIIERVKKYFDNVLGVDLSIIEDVDKRTGNKMYYYRVSKRTVVSLFINGFGAGKGAEGKKVPKIILNSDDNLKKSFLEGYIYDGDGSVVSDFDNRYKTDFIRVCSKSVDLSIGVNYLFKTLEHGKTKMNKMVNEVFWGYRNDKPMMNNIRTVSGNDEFYCDARIRGIKKVLPTTDYVYDIEVEGYHNFFDAEGNILVHNTDSVFIQLRGTTYEERMDEMNNLVDEINNTFDKFVQQFNKDKCECLSIDVDKVYETWLQTGAKKKYIGLYEWKDIDMRDRPYDERLDITGFEWKRIDQAKISKEVQYKVSKSILVEAGLKGAREYLNKLYDEITKGERDWDIGINGVIKQSIQTYKDNNSYGGASKACDWANQHGYEIGINDPFIWWWDIDGNPKAVPYDAEEIHEDININYDRMWKRNVVGKIEALLEQAVKGKFKINNFLEGKESKSIGEFIK